MLHLDPLDPYKPSSCSGTNNTAIIILVGFPGGGLENQNPARTIAHSPPGVKETLNYMLRENMLFEFFDFLGLSDSWDSEQVLEVSDMELLIPEIW